MAAKRSSRGRSRSESTHRYPRTARLDEVIAEVVASEVERLDDPRLDLATVTGCDVTNDLAFATIWFTSHTSDADALAALERAAPRLRGVLGRSIRVKQVPELIFKVDPSIATGDRIDALLRGDGRRTDSLDDPDDLGRRGSRRSR